MRNLMVLLVGTLILESRYVCGAHWSFSVELDNNYSVFWTPTSQYITFELQVRTLGYIGFGFSANGQMPGADLVIAWVQNNQVFLQDRHAHSGEDRLEPELDSSQDYQLLLGYENGTHTVIRFRRHYDTCDPHDYRITNDTMRVLYAYHSRDPLGKKLGSISYHGPLQRGAASLYLRDREIPEDSLSPDHLTWDLRNPGISLPNVEGTYYWCKIFKMPSIKRKHHIVKYEPILQGSNRMRIRRIAVYECQGTDSEFLMKSHESGQDCYQPETPSIYPKCKSVLIAWAFGSQGFTFPSEAGYPMDPDSDRRYYLMETQYHNPNTVPDIELTDNSGIRVYYTAILRFHDAGILSVGLDPNWRHIIPPGQSEVLSEGHCISTCTRSTLPHRGISIFAVALHTHLIGRKVRFRHVRHGAELPSIIADNNYDFSYQKYRLLHAPVIVYPGDHLIVECVYNSEDRPTITLGGVTSREEMCLVFGLYYPRIDLMECHSLPSLPTVLHSLGIQELWPGSMPVRIKEPPELSEMTLEQRLITYDWKNHFRSFQEVTHRGSFKPLCFTKTSSLLPGLENVDAFYPNFTSEPKVQAPCQNRWKKPRRRKKPGEDNQYTDEDYENGASNANWVYNDIGIHESSRLNYAVTICVSHASSVLITAFICYVLSFR